MKHRIPKKLHTVFNEYITDDEITEWLNDVAVYDTWDIDYDTMTLEITNPQQPYNIREFFTTVTEFFEDQLEAAE